MPTSKKQEIIDAIVRQINDGDLRPGNRIPTLADLRAQFDASITPVRAAVDWLRATGYIVTVPGVGMFVADHPPPAPSPE